MYFQMITYCFYLYEDQLYVFPIIEKHKSTHIQKQRQSAKKSTRLY